MLADLDLSWKEVNCFLRPQALICDEIAPGYGALFLFLTSLYRAWGIGGFFADRDKQHFDFTRSVFAELSGIEFDLARVAGEANVLDVVKERLSRGRPAIAPANLRELPYFRLHGKADQAHFFIVTGFDPAGRRFAVRDNLHLQPDHQSTAYEEWSLSEEIFERILLDYWATQVRVLGESAHLDRSHWILQIRPRDGFRRRDEREVLLLMLAEYERLLAGAGETGGRTTVDRRHLAAIWSASRRGDTAGLDPMVRAYLADANISSVHLRIALHAIERLGGTTAAVAERLRRSEKEAGALRTKLFVKMMVGGVPFPEWQDAGRALDARAEEVRRQMLNEIGEVLSSSRQLREAVG